MELDTISSGFIVAKLFLESLYFDFEILQILLMTCKEFYELRYIVLPLWSRCDGCSKLIRSKHYHNSYVKRGIVYSGNYRTTIIRPLIDPNPLYYGSEYCAEKRNTVCVRYIKKHLCKSDNCNLKRYNVWTKIKVQDTINKKKAIARAKKFKKIISRSGTGTRTVTFKTSQRDDYIDNHIITWIRKPNRDNDDIKRKTGTSKEILSWLNN